MLEKTQKEKEDSDKLILRMVDIISVLGDEYSNIYCVDRTSHNIEIYRYENTSVGVREVLNESRPYVTAIKGYINANVLEEDKEKMKIATNLENVCNRLKQAPQFSVHYRVKRNNEVLFYRMKCARIGDANSFQKIIFAFANEDADVRLNELEAIMKSSGMSGKRKILIVEDDDLNLEMLCDLLEDQYEIITAKNGKQGLKLLEEHYRELSLILLDVQMPVLDGIKVLEKVKEDALLSSVPIIVITVNDGIDTELTCLELGAVAMWST